MLLTALNTAWLCLAGLWGFRTSSVHCFWSVSVVACQRWLVAFGSQTKTRDVCLPKAAVAAEKFPSSPVASAVEQEKRESNKEVEGMCWWFRETHQQRNGAACVSVGNSAFGICFCSIFLVEVVFSLGLWLLSVSRCMLPPKLVLVSVGSVTWSDGRVCCLWSSEAVMITT